MGEVERRRRRLRHHGDGGTPDAEAASATTSAVHDDDGFRSPRGGRREPDSSDDGSRSPRGGRREPDSSDDGSRSPRGGRRAELESSEVRHRRAGPAAEDGERGLRGLVGSGSSQVSVTAALRARDATRPTDADLAEAEARIVIVRRNWIPRDELPRSGR